MLLNAEKIPNPMTLYRIPHAWERGLITHRLFKDMNRHEKRLFLKEFRKDGYATNPSTSKATK